MFLYKEKSVGECNGSGHPLGDNFTARGELLPRGPNFNPGGELKYAGLIVVPRKLAIVGFNLGNT
jgi:hypothetical protein